jgi:hypothetical protein
VPESLPWFPPELLHPRCHAGPSREFAKEKPFLAQLEPGASMEQSRSGEFRASCDLEAVASYYIEPSPHTLEVRVARSAVWEAQARFRKQVG